MTPEEIKQKVKDLCEDVDKATAQAILHNTAVANPAFRKAVIDAFVNIQTLVWFSATFVQYPDEP